jgi:restriction endonuclease
MSNAINRDYSFSRLGKYGAIALAVRTAQRVMPLLFGYKEIFNQFDQALLEIQKYAAYDPDDYSSLDDAEKTVRNINENNFEPKIKDVATIILEVFKASTFLSLAQNMPVGASGAAMNYGGQAEMSITEAINLSLKLIGKENKKVNERIIEDCKILEEKIDIEDQVPLDFFESNTNFFRDDPHFANSNIIKMVSLFDAALIKKFNYNPSALFKLTSREFEELVGELWAKFGWNVELTAKVRDGGRDLIAIRSNPVPHKFLIECKRWNEAVGVGVVRALHGVVEDEKANKGIVVTTSWFSKNAQNFLERNSWRLSGTDFKGLTNWLRDYQYLEMFNDLGIRLL